MTAGFYQCNDHYNVPKFITLMANLIVAIVLITGAIKNIYAYLALLVFGSILNFTVDVLAAVKYGFRYTPAFDLKNNELKKMLIVFLPTLFSSGVYKIHTMVDTTIAANLLEGQITSWQMQKIRSFLVVAWANTNITIWIKSSQQYWNVVKNTLSPISNCAPSMHFIYRGPLDIKKSPIDSELSFNISRCKLPRMELMTCIFTLLRYRILNKVQYKIEINPKCIFLSSFIS